MRIYVPAVVEGQEWVVPREEDTQWLWALGPQRCVPWKRPSVDLLQSHDNGNPRSYSDLPWFQAGFLILKLRAHAALGSALCAYGELLPLKCEDLLWLFNATAVLDALDLQASTIVRFDDGGILEIKDHIFRSEAVGGNQVFKLVEAAQGWSTLYLQESMVRLIGETGLLGAAFDLVWTDEVDPEIPRRIEYV